MHSSTSFSPVKWLSAKTVLVKQFTVYRWRPSSVLVRIPYKQLIIQIQSIKTGDTTSKQLV